jgi:hypothetical protein
VLSRGVPQAGLGGVPGMAPATSETEREQAAPRRMTLTESEERSRSC